MEQKSLDRPLLGMSLMLGFCIVAPLGDAVAKLLGGRVGIGELLLFRFGIQALVLIPLVAVTNRAWRMNARVMRLTLLRTFLHIFGIGAMVMALQHMPLADAVAIAFVMPFIMLILGYFFLNETIGWPRLSACAVGFVGTLLVIQPSLQEVGLYALLPLLVAVSFSFFILTTRAIAKETDPIGLQAVSGVMAVVILLPVELAGDHFGLAPFEFISPNAYTLFLLFGIGIVGTIAHLLMTWSLRYAPAASLAPMQYLEIPVATIIGLVIFGDFPNGMAAIGIAITVAAGLYVMMFEKISQQARAMRGPGSPALQSPPSKPVVAE